MTTPALAVIGVVALINLLLIGAYVAMGRRQAVVDERLGQLGRRGAAPAPAARIPAGGRRASIMQPFDQALAGRGFAERMRRELARADMKLTVGEYLAVHVLIAALFFGLGWLVFGSVFLGVVTGLGGLFVPRFYVGVEQRRRLRRFDNQLGDMLNLVVNGLRAGYSSMQALESVARELPPPISVEFQRVVQEIQLGLPQEAALANLVRRVPSADLDFVITAMNVQREVGGNLAEILDNISYTIRERVRIRGEIATLTAQGQITAWVISLMPIILALILFVLNRSYMMQMFGPPIIMGVPLCGIAMIVTALLMIVIGFAIVQKIVDIEI